MKPFIEIGIAVLLAYIAVQNYLINKSNFRIYKDKFRLDLFDRRYKTFEAVQNFLKYVLSEGKPERGKIFQLKTESTDSEFLFGSEIKEYINETSTKGLKLILLHERLERGGMDKSSIKNTAEEMEVLESWFGDQIMDSRKIFMKYLRISIPKEQERLPVILFTAVVFLILILYSI